MKATPEDRLVRWIKQQLSYGQDIRSIKMKLLQMGMDERDVNEIVAQALEIDRRGKTHSMLSLEKTVFLISTLMICGGAIALIASNLDKIPDFMKICSVFVASIVFYYLGWRDKIAKELKTRRSEVFISIATILAGLTIFVVEQVFNVKPKPFILGVPIMQDYLLFGAIALYSAYIFRSKGSFHLGVIATIAATFVLPLERYPDSYISIFQMRLMFFGVLLYLVGAIHKITPFHRFYASYQRYAVILITTSFLLSIFIMREIIFGGVELTSLIKLSIILGALIGSGYLLRRINLISLEEMMYLIFCGIYMALYQRIYVFLYTLFLYNLSGSVSDSFHVVTNLLLLIAYSWTMMWAGMGARNKFMVNVGVLVFLIAFFYLYFSTVVKLSLGGLGFIFGGVLLLFLGMFLEKRRRKLILSMGGERDER